MESFNSTPGSFLDVCFFCAEVVPFSFVSSRSRSRFDIFFVMNMFGVSIVFVITFPETDIAPTNGWLEYDPFLLGFGLFSGAKSC